MRQGINSRIVMACLLAGLGYTVSAEVHRQYTYVETGGAVDSLHTVTVWQNGDEIETHWVTPEKTFVSLSDKTGNTREWRVQYADVDIIARRTGNLIRLSGTRNGTSFREDLEIDESPWFQPLSYALSQFSQSEQEAVVFWTIRPDNLDVVKLTAGKVGLEQVHTKAGTFPAQKLRVSVRGFLSHFWKAYYWFQEADGLFVRYEASQGLPGTPPTTIQLGG